MPHCSLRPSTHQLNHRIWCSSRNRIQYGGSPTTWLVDIDRAPSQVDVNLWIFTTGPRSQPISLGVLIEAPKVLSTRRRRCRGGGPLGGYIPLPSWLESRKLPSGVRGWAPSEKLFYCFISVSERLSLQRLLKINVVHSRPLVEKNWFVQWVGSDPLRQTRQIPRQFIFLQFLRWKVDKNRFRVKFWDIKCDFAVWLLIISVTNSQKITFRCSQEERENSKH